MAKAAELAYQAIRDGIIEGRFRAGARLREEEIAEATGVSRTPVREALRRLDAEGLVEFLPNRGAHVASWSSEELEQIFDLRALLEGYGAKLAAPRATAEVIAELESLADRMEATARRTSDPGAVDEVSTLNNAFHRVILQTAGNDRLAALLSSLVELSLVHRTFRRYSPEALARSMAHHRELIDALRAGDGPWAESVMTSHVLAARAALAAPDEAEDTAEAV